MISSWRYPAPASCSALVCAAARVLFIASASLAAPAFSQTGAPSGGGDPHVYDSFDRPPATGLGVATTGQTWTMHAAGFGIENGQAAPGGGFSFASVDAGLSAMEASVSLTAPGTEFWLLLRMQDSNNYWRFGRRQNQVYELQQIVENQLGTPAVTTLASVMAAAGDVLACRSVPVMLECSVNGVPVVRTSSTAGASASRAGLMGYMSSATRFDNFVVTDLPPAPDLSAALTGPSVSNGNTLSSWTATFRNLATIPAPGVEATLSTSASISQVAITGAACTATGSTWTCGLGTLAPGQTVSLTIQGVTPGASGPVTVTTSVPVQAGEYQLADNDAEFATYVHGATGGSLHVYDSFDRPPATGLGVATTGQTWTMHAAGFGIENGQAAPGGGFSFASVDAGLSAMEASVSLTAPGTEFWLLLRMQDSNNYWRFGRRQNQAYELQQIVQNQLGTPAVTTLASVMAAAGDVLACRSVPVMLECSVNGVPVVRTSSTAGASASRAGLMGYMSSATRFDNFVVTDLPPAPDLSASLTGPSVSNGNTLSSWTATFRNLATIPAPGVEATLSTSATISQVVITGAACTATGSSWRCVLGTLAPGQTVSLTIQGVTPGASGPVTVTASLPVQAGEYQLAYNDAGFATYVHNSTGDHLYLFDSFDRPAATGLGVATTGQTWTVHAAGFGIENGQAAPGGGFSFASLDAGLSAMKVSVSMVAPGTEFWLLLRMQDSNNYWRFGRRQNQAYELQQTIHNQLGTPAVTTLATVMAAAGDTITCESSQAFLECAVNGVLVARTTVSDGASATRLGLMGYLSIATRFDNLLVLGPPPAPNLTVQVNTVANVQMGESHLAEIVVRNAGHLASGNGSLAVSLDPWLTVVSHPTECTLQAGAFSCPVPGLAPSAVRHFSFMVRSNEPFSGHAVASVAGDSSASDNAANWTTWVHTGTGYVMDRFDRADTPSGLGTTLTQQSWTMLSPGFRISNNHAQAAAGGALAIVNPGYAFGTIEVVLGSNASTTGLIFRAVNANNYFRLAADENGYYGLRKIVNGVTQTLTFGYTRALVRPAPGDLVRLVTRPDDGIFVAVNGQQILDFGDQQFMFETGWGLASVGGPASVDAFTVDPRMVGYATLDTFDNADGLPLSQPTIGSKYNWRPWLGTPWITLAGRARPTDSDYTYTWVDTATEQANIEAKIVQLGQGGWVIFRFDEFDETYFRFGQQAGAYSVDFMHNWAISTMPVPVQVLASPIPQPGDIIRVHQRTDGTVECSVNGVITHRFVDNVTNFRWTTNGLAAEGSQAAFDDFKVTPFNQ